MQHPTLQAAADALQRPGSCKGFIRVDCKEVLDYIRQECIGLAAKAAGHLTDEGLLNIVSCTILSAADVLTGWDLLHCNAWFAGLLT